MVRSPQDKGHAAAKRSRGRGLTLLAATSLCAGTVLIAGPGRVAAAGTSVWLQTMDSCRQALGGASYQVASTSTSFRENVSTPASAPRSVGGGPCPLQRGDCAARVAGCVQIASLAPGRYRITETKTPRPTGAIRRDTRRATAAAPAAPSGPTYRSTRSAARRR